MVVVIGGLDKKALDEKGQRYLRLFCRLIDKAYDEYTTVKPYIEKEIKSENRLEYLFAIINHLENCINALNRAGKAFGEADTNAIMNLMPPTLKERLNRLISHTFAIEWNTLNKTSQGREVEPSQVPFF